MRPLRIIACSWVAGIGIARLCEGTPVAVLSYALVLSLCGLMLLLRRVGHRLGLALYACGVAAWVALPTPALTAALSNGRPWTFVAWVDGAQRLTDRLMVPIALEQARVDNTLVDIEGRVRLLVPRVREPLSPGDRLLVQGRVALPGRTCNFGDCDGAWRAAADALDGTIVARTDDVMRIAGPTHGAYAWLWQLRLRMRAAIFAQLAEREAALVAALVIGDRGALDATLEARFVAVGVTHLLSVSGLHLAFVAGLLFAVIRKALALWPMLGRSWPRDRWAALVALPLVAAYATLVGAEVATVRAALVVGYAFFAIVACRRLRGADALVFAALALLITRPARLYDVSFQLSFVSALALLAVPRWQVASTWQRRVRSVATMALASLAATLATAPLTASWFAQVAPMGIVSNAVAIPLTELLLVPLGIVGALLSLASPLVGWLPLQLAGFCAWLLLRFVDALATVAPIFTLPAPSTLCLLACAIGLLWVARRPGLRRTLAALAGVAIILLAEHAWARLRARVAVTFLDVGQGDAAVVVDARGNAIVIDGGPDAAGRAVLHELRRRGVHRVRLVVLSHPHPDHSNGLAPLFDELPVDELWHNGQDSNDPGTRALIAAARRHAVPIVRPHVVRFGNMTIAPVALRDAPDPLASDNDNSLVLRLSYGGRSVLFPGDIEEAAEERVLEQPLAPADILKVPHHASRTSSTNDLLERLRPAYAVASLGLDNRYRFPHPDVVARYREHGAAFYRTDRDGAVELSLGPRGGITIECARPGGCSP